MNDYYYNMELRIRKNLVQQYQKTFRAAQKEFRYFLRRENLIKANQSDFVLKMADTIFSEYFKNQFPNSVEDFLEEKTGETYNHAKKETQKAGEKIGLEKPAFAFGINDLKSKNWLRKFNNYWIGEYYDNILQEKIIKAGEKLFDEGLTRDSRTQLFAKTFKDMIVKAGYWEMYSTNIVTNTRELSNANTYDEIGAKFVVIDATIDHRTSDACRLLDGKIVEVAAAVKQRDKLINSTDPEAVKQARRWIGDTKSATYQHLEKHNISGDKLTGDYIALPPFHANCRTRSRVIA